MRPLALQQSEEHSLDLSFLKNYWLLKSYRKVVRVGDHEQENII